MNTRRYITGGVEAHPAVEEMQTRLIDTKQRGCQLYQENCKKDGMFDAPTFAPICEEQIRKLCVPTEK